MRKKPLFKFAAAAGLATSSPALAQGMSQPAGPVSLPGIKTSYVRLAGGAPGVFYEPVSPGPKARIAVFAMHASGDYLTFSACGELGRRGYRVLCANNSTDKSGTFDPGVMDRAMLEMKGGIGWLRAQPEIAKVVLFGHSGGATLMTAYQMIAEGGVKACNGPEKLHKCPDSLAGLPPTDGVVVADANWGQAEMVLLSMDPAVTDDRKGTQLNSALDMYNPANGYKKEGSSYSAAFRKAFFAAAGARNNRLIKQAQERHALIEVGKGDFADDEPFTAAGASYIANRLFTEDTTLLARTEKAWPLLHGDGTVTTEIVHSLRKPVGRTNPTARWSGALRTTVSNFLTNYAIRALPDFGYDATGVRGIDWTSTYSSPPGNVQGIGVPLLAMGMTGNWEYLAAETIYEHARSADKSIAFVEGANHIYMPCTGCTKPASAFGDTIKTTYDHVDQWLSKPGRF